MACKVRSKVSKSRVMDLHVGAKRRILDSCRSQAMCSWNWLGRQDKVLTQFLDLLQDCYSIQLELVETSMRKCTVIRTLLYRFLPACPCRYPAPRKLADLSSTTEIGRWCTSASSAQVEMCTRRAVSPRGRITHADGHTGGLACRRTLVSLHCAQLWDDQTFSHLLAIVAAI